jgi:hypothetical protein
MGGGGMGGGGMIGGGTGGGSDDEEEGDMEMNTYSINGSEPTQNDRHTFSMITF